jgi:hypothetical protein
MPETRAMRPSTLSAESQGPSPRKPLSPAVESCRDAAKCYELAAKQLYTAAILRTTGHAEEAVLYISRAANYGEQATHLVAEAHRKNNEQI